MRLAVLIGALAGMALTTLGISQADSLDTTLIGDVVLMESDHATTVQNLTTATLIKTSMPFQLKNDPRASEGGIVLTFEDFSKQDLSNGAKYVVLHETQNGGVTAAPAVDRLSSINLYIVYQQNDLSHCVSLGVSAQMPCVVVPYKDGVQFAAMLKTLYNGDVSWSEIKDQYPVLAGNTTTASEDDPSTDSTSDSAADQDNTDPSLIRRLFIRPLTTENGQVVKSSSASSSTNGIIGGVVSGVVVLLMIACGFRLRRTIRRQRELEKKKVAGEQAYLQRQKQEAKPKVPISEAEKKFDSRSSMGDLEIKVVIAKD
ncbi:hypothetical protein H4R33_003766 [Dimargaris cristalligena]|nr:hypothetical protein H4R33_003766 [Dimargaris cristalligena]